MKSNRNLIIACLILLLGLPLEAAAASWMSRGVTEHDAGLHADPDLAATGSHHHVGAAYHLGDQHQHSMTPVEHNCDDDCMNCSSHCFSAALVSVAGAAPDRTESVSAPPGGNSLSRAYLLFRPPIRETGTGRLPASA